MILALPWIGASFALIGFAVCRFTTAHDYNNKERPARNASNSSGENEPLLPNTTINNSRTQEPLEAVIKPGLVTQGILAFALVFQLAIYIFLWIAADNNSNESVWIENALVFGGWALVAALFFCSQPFNDHLGLIRAPAYSWVICGYATITFVSLLSQSLPPNHITLVDGLQLIAAVIVGCAAFYQHTLFVDQIEFALDAATRAQGKLIPSRESFKNGLFNNLFFTWMNPMLRLGEKRHLTVDDIWDLNERDKAGSAVKSYTRVQGKYKTLWVSMVALEYPDLLYMLMVGAVSALLSVSGPFFLYQITGYIQNPEGRSISEVYLYVCLLPVCTLSKALFDNRNWHYARKVGMRIKGILVNEIFVKSLKRANALSAESKSEDGEKKDKSDDDDKNEADDQATVGKIVTLMSSDAEKIRDTIPFVTDTVNVPIQMTVSIAGLLHVIGWPAFAGMAVMVATIPIISVITKWSNDVFERLMSKADKRTTVVNEVLQGIRIIKYFAWEKNFLEKIDLARENEMKSLIEYYINGAVQTFTWCMTPLLVAFFTLLTVTLVAKQKLDAQMAFTCISLFNTLRIPMLVLPEIIIEIYQLKVSLDRISRFLSQEELGKYNPKQELSELEEPIKNPPVIGFVKSWSQWYGNSKTASSSNDAESSSSATEATPLLNRTASSSKVSIMTDGSTSETAAFTLRDINVSFPINGLTAICGATGAGKSSMLLALLGEMKQLSGKPFLPDPRKPESIEGTNLTTGVAYVSQTSWLQNATIRDNILFGEPYDAVRYDKVIKACALVKDLETLEAGDLTEIGEKGINLSGGQKQRVSLARAVYSRAAFVLLDDPLSAVDAPTARHLFDHSICGLLAGRTRILVTHATSLVLPRADYLVVMQSGEVLASGTVAEVSEMPGVKSVISKEEAAAIASGRSLSSESVVALDLDENAPLKDYANGKTSEDARKLVEIETSQKGAVRLTVYTTYIGSAGGLLFVLLVLASGVADRFLMVLNDYWVKSWAEAFGPVNKTDAFMTANLHSFSVQTVRPNVGALSMLAAPKLMRIWTNGTIDEPVQQEVDSVFYIMIYALISFGWVLVFLTTFTIRSIGSYRASKTFHQSLMDRILYAPIRFFDTTPIGRILNRATKDISVIDKNVMGALETFMACTFDALTVFVVVAMATPAFLLFVAPVGYIYLRVATRYIASSRELKRIDSVTRSPIYSMFSETLVGCSTIRAYGAEERFIQENLKRVDTNHRAYFYMWCTNRWLGVRISSIAAFAVFLSCLSIVNARQFIGAGFAALALTWTLTLSDVLIWIVRVHAQMEMNMNAVERVNEYLEIDQEKPAIIPTHRPSPNWPTHGGINIKNLTMRYAPELDPVLVDVSFKVLPGEKVGVVGRTGAGKSSLSLSLFRIVEASSGSIEIDGVDISTIGLFDLRSRLTMIPQDPVLFAGTIRSNLDPFSEHDDEKIWGVLSKVRFLQSLQAEGQINRANLSNDEISIAPTTTVLSIENDSSARPPSVSSKTATLVESRNGLSLDSTVAEGGTNYSQGQRQLLCLARALLKQSTITVFDEATASVDNETDSNIQKVIRGPEFAKITVLSIAHRLRTVADYDKILVLDKGRVDQFGTPYELMQKEGRFKTMCVESGEFDELLAMAKR